MLVITSKMIHCLEWVVGWQQGRQRRAWGWRLREVMWFGTSPSAQALAAAAVRSPL